MGRATGASTSNSAEPGTLAVVDRSNARGLRSAVVRQGNLATLLGLLHLRGAASRSELVAHSGLTRSAIGGLVADLVELGYVSETSSASLGRPGRPSTNVLPLSERNVAISVVLMANSLTVSAVGLGGLILASRAAPPPLTGWTVDDTVEQTAALIDDLQAQLVSEARVFGVGVAVPGLVRHADGGVVVAPNLGWTDVPLGRRLEEALASTVPIVVRNEANVGALAESRRGVAAGQRHALYLSGEVGVGGGVISDGEVMAGSSGFAGEIGHLHVNNAGTRCRCGAVGCWESEVGEEALLNRYGRGGTGAEAIGQLLSAASAGEAEAIQALAEHGTWVGLGLAGLVNVLNPEIVVLGGLFAETMEWIRPTMEAELGERSLKPVREQCVVIASALGSSALPLGAAELVWDVVLDDPGRASFRFVSVD